MTTNRLGGWWRLWIVFVVLWAILMGINNVDRWPVMRDVPTDSRIREAFLQDLERRYADTSTNTSKSAFDRINPFQRQLDALLAGSEASHDSLAAVADNAGDDSHSFAVREMRRQLSALRRVAAWTVLFQAASAPLLVLLAGFSVRWIYWGFRSKKAVDDSF